MTDLILPRRKFLAGLVGLIAAPAVVRAASLMPVKAYDLYRDQSEIIRAMSEFMCKVNKISAFPDYIEMSADTWDIFMVDAEKIA